jgi:hypothetical protein
VLTYVSLLALCAPVGTFWHEVMGHALVGVICGGRVREVIVLGTELYPQVGWVGWHAWFGSCYVDQLPSAAAEHVMSLAGSVSTWLVGVVATITLYIRAWRGLARAVLVCASLWWIDLATYLLPALGLRRWLFWGGTYSEPYEAAIGLGIPGPFFLTLALASSALLASALAGRLIKDRRASATN